MKTPRLEILEESKLPTAQARAIPRVMEPEMTATQDRFATKHDILELRVELKGIEGALSRWVLTCILGQTAVLAGLGYFLIARLGK
jgi:hypothetical protein